MSRPSRKNQVSGGTRQRSGLSIRRPLNLVVLSLFLTLHVSDALASDPATTSHAASNGGSSFWSFIFVFALATVIGLGVIARVSRLLHTPLMSITNAISAIAVVGSILVTGGDFPEHIRLMGAIALFASVTNIVSGFMITDRMLKMFKKQ